MSTDEWDALLLAVEGPSTDHLHTVVVFDGHATGICTVCRTAVRI